MIAGPISGALSDRFGARWFSFVGLALVGASFIALLVIPVNFDYWEFAIITGINGVGSGLFSSPNRTAIMNSVPANARGSASGMAGVALNAGSSLSIGIFFSLMIAGLSTALPSALTNGLASNGVPAGVAGAIGQTPPVGSLFAAFLGYNPIKSLLAPTGVHLSSAHSAVLTGNEFFPQLISTPFHDGLVVVFIAAAIMSVVGAVISLFGGAKYVHSDEPKNVAVLEASGSRT
jgi:MFS family permease